MRTLSAILIISTISVSGFGQTANPFVPLVNIPGTAANLPGGVKGVAVDSAGNVFFVSGGYSVSSDYLVSPGYFVPGGYSVLRWDHATGILSSVAGNGTPGFSGDNGPATSAQLDGASGVAVDGAGNLYIADSNNALIRKVSNGVITTVAGGGPDDCDNCPATSAHLDETTGVTTDSAGNLYIFTGGIVRKVSNGVIAQFLGSNTLFSNGEDYPSGAAAMDNAEATCTFVNYILHRIQKVSNGMVTTAAGTGMQGYSGDNGPAASAQLNAPHGVAVDAAGNLYIADTGNQRIRKVSNGVITTVAGGGSASGGLGDNGPATSGLLNNPFGVGLDSSGNFYIEDTGNQRIRKVSNGVITTVAGGGSTSVLLARSAGTFAVTGSMSTARTAHTATLLGDGKVLIAGGYADGFVTTSELYDPATGTFASTGNLTAALTAPTATLLADGRVLIVGDLQYAGPAGAELYDPSTGTFSAAAAGPLNIFGPTTATLLNSGKVLLTGPSGPMKNTNFVAEIYDPLAGTFTAIGSTAWDHFGPTATLLANGKVLIAEGICGGAYGSNAGGSELYDPASGTFSPTAGNMTSCTFDSKVTLLPNGKVLIAGGLGVGAEVYDPSTGTFTASAAINADGNASTLLPDGTVLISGGTVFLGPDESVADGDLYDPSTGTFGSAGAMTTPRSWHQSTLLSDGTVLISGGDWLTYGDTVLASAEIYAPPVLVPAPVLFSISGLAQGQGAIWHATGQIASSQSPAVAGEVLAMYTTSLFEGGVVPPQVAIGGQLGEILYFGDAPGYPGYYQVNVRVPSGVAAGPAVPVRLTYLGRPSNEVTIGVQ